MIIFVTTGWHKYGPHELESLPGAPEVDIVSYNALFKRTHLPVATYIFTDFDRLNFWQTELAALIFRQLEAGGATVINDPARVLERLALLKRLHRAGLNSFNVWDAAGDPLPDRYPVFLRTQSAHRGPLTDLLDTEDAAKAALEAHLNQGYGVQDLMFVEYCAEPLENGAFRKLAAFKVGDRIQMAMAVHENRWQAKYGDEGAGSQTDYEVDFASVDENPRADALRAYFDVANIDYGRADFTIVDGLLQVYEINTNPHISLIDDHPVSLRMKTQDLFVERLIEALIEIDRPLDRKARIELNDERLVSQRKRDWLVLRDRWLI